MTRKIFWSAPYQTQLDTRISTVHGAEVGVEATIIFAFAGGQESDQGTIGGFPVLAARKLGRELVYTLPDSHTLQPGQAVDMAIDWPRRYKLMRLHFGAELVLELLTQRFPGIEKIGAHIGADKARVDFLWPESLAAQLPALADAANHLIAADLEIRTGFEQEAEERRYWEIDCFARVACGGTHVRRSGEVGPLRLRRHNLGRGKERVEIFLQS